MVQLKRKFAIIPHFLGLYPMTTPFAIQHYFDVMIKLKLYKLKINGAIKTKNKKKTKRNQQQKKMRYLAKLNKTKQNKRNK